MNSRFRQWYKSMLYSRPIFPRLVCRRNVVNRIHLPIFRSSIVNTAKRTLCALGSIALISSPAAADILNDAAPGSWDVAATWGGSTVADGDTLNIDEYTVTFYKLTVGTLPNNLVINLGGTGKFDTNYDTSITTAATVNFLGTGGTFSNQRGTLFSGGLALNITGANNTYDLKGAGEFSRLGSSSSVATSTVVTGTGTLTIIGGGALELRSIVNVLDADGGTPGNQTRTNPSTFSGKWDVQNGKLELGVPEFTKFATVNLGGTVAGTAADTNFDVSPHLSMGSNGGTYVGTQMEVNTLTGTGRASWNTTTGYYRDLAIGTLLDPGAASEAGLIMRHTGGASNDLVMRPGSTMAFDVFSDASADQVVWKSSNGVSGMVFNEANLVVRLFTPDASVEDLSWILIDGDEWISKSTQGSSTATPIADQAFASISYLNALGGTLNEYTGPGDLDGGWYDLGIHYLGTSGSSNRQVELTGSYMAPPIPEPGTLGLAALGGLMIAVRGRRRA